MLAPPPGVKTPDLIEAVSAAVQQRLGWKPSKEAADPAWQGLPFDGQTSGDGGFVNSVSAQLGHAYGELDVGAARRDGSRLIAAMKASPTGVVVRIMHNR